MTNIDKNCKAIDAAHPHIEISKVQDDAYSCELSTNDKIIYVTKECGHKMSFVHDSICVQIKDNRPVGVQYGLPYGFTFDQAVDELYKYVKGF